MHLLKVALPASASCASAVADDATMFKALRTQMDELGIKPDHRIYALSELPDLVALA